MTTPATGPAKTKAVAPVTPPKDTEKEKLRQERDELTERLNRAEENRKLERRTIDPASDDFDAELAIERLWPGQVRE